MERALVKVLVLGVAVCLLMAAFSCTRTVYVTPAPTTAPTQMTTLTTTPTPIPLPVAPSNTGAEAISCNTVNLLWTDRCNNEEGFRIYRNGMLLGTVGANVNTFQDKALQYAMSYNYSISAYNESGESPRTAMISVTTPNPPIRIVLNAVGVYDSGDSFLRGTEGEQYLYLVVTDGEDVQELRLPAQEHFHLDQDEVVSVGSIVFYTPEVGDHLRLFVTGWEADGGSGESVIYKAIGAAALEAVTGGIAVPIASLFTGVLEDIIGSIFYAEDDPLGTYEQIWYSNDLWGVGEYNDVGIDNLRLWFTISVAE